jgi:hypothetical protein
MRRLALAACLLACATVAHAAYYLHLETGQIRKINSACMDPHAPGRARFEREGRAYDPTEWARLDDGPGDTHEAHRVAMFRVRPWHRMVDPDSGRVREMTPAEKTTVASVTSDRWRAVASALRRGDTAEVSSLVAAYPAQVPP